jgi:hypothetical protein
MKKILITLLMLVAIDVTAQEKATIKIETVLLKIKGKTIMDEKLDTYAVLTSDSFTIIFTKENDTYFIAGLEKLTPSELPKGYDVGFTSKAVDDESNICIFYIAQNKATKKVVILIRHDNIDSYVMFHGKFI